MALSKYKLGELIEQRREKYNCLDELPVRGVSRNGFILAKQPDADKSMYNVFYKYDFVFNPARMELNSIALNTEFDKAICSSLYEIFYIKNKEIILPEYLNVFVKRQEFARQCEYIGWGSAREYCKVSSISDIDILLPPIEIQQKYVDIYQGMVNNQKAYERGLEDLKLVCDGYFDVAKKQYTVSLGELIEKVDVRNSSNLYSAKDVRGITNKKEFSETKADISTVDLSKFKVVKPRQFAYNSRTDGREMLVLALNREDYPIIVTFNYNVFSIRQEKIDMIDLDYLYAFFKRSEFDRRVRFNSWGSSQELLSWDNLCNIQVPVPTIKKQEAVAEIINLYFKRKAINERLKAQIKDICPILIKGSIDEAR